MESNHPLFRDAFPRSNQYDPDWMVERQMGPNAIWLTEWLCQALDLQPEMRILDLGCGKAMSSVFLARELGVRVWAVDLWAPADDNWTQAQRFGLQDRIYPLRAEAHALPFPKGFFHAALSVDAYQYFGTDELYLSYLTRYVVPGGMLGIVVPGLTQPIDGDPPEHLARPQSNGKIFWEPECVVFHTAAWWRSLWLRANRLDDVVADTLPDGWQHWHDFERAVERSSRGLFPSDAEVIAADGGRFLGFVRVVGRNRPHEGENLYDPAILERLEAAARTPG